MYLPGLKSTHACVCADTTKKVVKNLVSVEVVESSRHFSYDVVAVCREHAVVVHETRRWETWTHSSSKWCLPETGAICWIASSVPMVFPKYFLSQCHSLSQPVTSLRRDSSVPPLGAGGIFCEHSSLQLPHSILRWCIWPELGCGAMMVWRWEKGCFSTLWCWS